MRAVILAGGMGTRLRPYTTVIPKPLVPIGDRPVLEHIIRTMMKSGIEQIDLCVSHLGELILVYLASADIPPSIRLNFHWEDEPLGTAGALVIALPMKIAGGSGAPLRAVDGFSQALQDDEGERGHEEHVHACGEVRRQRGDPEVSAWSGGARRVSGDVCRAVPGSQWNCEAAAGAAGALLALHANQSLETMDVDCRAHAR